MGKYHHNARFEDHVITNVCVVTGHHHHRLLPGNPPSCVLLILPVKDKDQSLYYVYSKVWIFMRKLQIDTKVSPSIHLPCFQGLQAGRPSAFMCVFHQLGHYVDGTSRFLE